MLINAGASRTLDPSHRSFVGVTGLHDKRLTDADLNLSQAIQDLKRHKAMGNHVCSGALTYSPFVFSARGPFQQPLTFSIPAYDVVFNGDVVTIGGNLSSTLTSNTVRIPPPVFWSPGAATDPASIYIVFIEFWYQRLNPLTATGYFQDSSGLLYFYPNGCVNAAFANLIPNDTIDPFQGQETTERSQIQWAIRVQKVDLAYDFTQYSLGLDPGATSTEIVYGQAGQTSPSTAAPFEFSNMATINGDPGLWRCGDGNYLNELGTMDGYSYAMPVAVVFQRNSGVFSVQNNPLGTADSHVIGSGTLYSKITGRFDGKYCDVIFPEDVIDTRSTVALAGFDDETLVRQSFVDTITGTSRLALTRGVSPGGNPGALGSLLDYTIAVAPASVANTNTIGSFDGLRNGFSSGTYTSYVTKAVTVDQKTTGVVGGPWLVGDSFVVTLPGTSQGTIEFAQAQGLVNNSVNGTKVPVLFLSGQVSFGGIGTKTVTIQFAKNLTGTSYDPGMNPIYVTLGVEYMANSGMDLAVIPAIVPGGRLNDSESGKHIPVYGVSSYAVSAPLASITAYNAYAFNPGYSDTVFGTRVSILIGGPTGITGVNSVNAQGNPITTYSISRLALNTNLTGIYVVGATDYLTGAVYPILNRSISGTNFILQLQGTIASTTTVVATFLAADTAQLSYCAPIKAVTMIEETVIAGTVADSNFLPDPRISVVSVQNFSGDHNSVVLATVDGTLTGIAGDDVNKLIWVQDTSGNYNAVQVSAAVFANGFVTLTVPPTVNLVVQKFFVVAALLPAFAAASQMVIMESYVPYQGEGLAGRDYEVMYSEPSALVTTNGTGTAPVPGLRDIYPYNREYPISAALPAQISWSDATLLNQPVASLLDSNYDSKSFENVEHTLEVVTHTNDFIEPINSNKRKTFQLELASGGRGYAKATPHMGFAITALTAKTSVGQDVTSTSGSIILYVNNITGNDANDGLTPTTALWSISQALSRLPSVLRHPCSIQLVQTYLPYSLTSYSSALAVASFGDGVIRPSKYYALGLLSSTVQNSGRLVITAMAGTVGVVTIDATGYTDFGDGPTSAFLIDNTRVLFNQIEFKGFAVDPAVKGLDAFVEFSACLFTNNTQAASFEQGSTVVLTGGTMTPGPAGTGFVISTSDMEVSGMSFVIPSSIIPGALFVVERGSSLTLVNHSPNQETGVTSSVVIASALLNSSITATPTFSSLGSASIIQNSVLSRSVAINPFSGGVVSDVSSSISTSL